METTFIILGYSSLLLIAAITYLKEPFNGFFYKMVPNQSGDGHTSKPTNRHKITIGMLLCISISYQAWEKFRSINAKNNYETVVYAKDSTIVVLRQDIINIKNDYSRRINYNNSRNINNDNSNNYGGGIHHNQFNYHKDSFKGGEIDVLMTDGDQSLKLKADSTGRLQKMD